MIQDLEILDKIRVLFVYSLPEGLAVAYCTSAFLNVKIRVRLILGLGTALALMPYFFRLLPLHFGMHTLFSGVLFSLLLSWVYARSKLTCFAAVLKVFLILAVVELLVVTAVCSALGVTPEVVYRDYQFAILPQVLVIFAVGMLVMKFSGRRERARNV